MVAQWKSVRLGIEGWLVVYLSKTLYPLLGTGLTQEDRESLAMTEKNVDWDVQCIALFRMKLRSHCTFFRVEFLLYRR